MRESFEYEGHAYGGDGPNDQVTVDKQTFTVIEFCPYEPSNYVHAPYWYVTGEDGAEYAIDAGDLDAYEGRCWDCGQRHEKNDCHFDQEAA